MQPVSFPKEKVFAVWLDFFFFFSFWRGNAYFRVEELRDSTAHAEMICIREASNVLRTWRLAVKISFLCMLNALMEFVVAKCRKYGKLTKFFPHQETTLYVTLEPCAMCAGAILQARISTLVWGAPNKLLGADGSWVRYTIYIFLLFCSHSLTNISHCYSTNVHLWCKTRISSFHLNVFS